MEWPMSMTLRACAQKYWRFLIWRFGARSPNRQIKCIANISTFTVYIFQAVRRAVNVLNVSTCI